MKKIFFVIVSTLFFTQSAFAGKGYTTDTQPATCVDGDFWIDTNGATGERFYVCEEGSWVKSVGYGTSANPSFNSIHASGGNLAAANAQVTKKWITGLPYTANVTSVIYGGKHYICTSTHTADSTTEPGVGASWETVWSEVVGGSGATAIDDLTDVDTTGKATGKILKFDASGNLVVGDDSTGSGSVPSGTVNGQVLLWATDQWAASTPPWVTTASLGSGVGTWLATPSGSNLASALTSALPASKGGTGLTSLGTGVAAALAAAVDGTGGLASKASLDALPNIVFGTGIAVAEDTPSSGTDTVSVDADATPTDGSAKPITSNAVYDALAGKQSTLVSGANVKTINNTSILGSGNITINDGTGGGLTATLSSAPYSDVACTADGVYNHTLYKCIDNGSGTGYFTEYVATIAYLNATPVDTTPDAFTFADVTNAELSTEYIALAQINGIAAGITCSGSGGTVAACTGSTVGTCGTFGSTSGSITNGQYVGAKVTSSATASTSVSNVVTCGGVVSDPAFIVTTASASSCSSQSLIYDYSTLNYNDGNLYETSISAFAVTGTGKRLYSVGFKTGNAANGSATTGLYKVLVSTNQDFSGTLVDEFYINTPGAINTAFSALSGNRPILSDGTTYYVGIYANGATYAQLVNLGRSSASGKTAYKVTGIGGTVTTTSNQTHIGEVKVCDN